MHVCFFFQVQDGPLFSVPYNKLVPCSPQKRLVMESTCSPMMQEAKWTIILYNVIISVHSVFTISFFCKVQGANKSRKHCMLVKRGNWETSAFNWAIIVIDILSVTYVYTLRIWVIIWTSDALNT